MTHTYIRGYTQQHHNHSNTWGSTRRKKEAGRHQKYARKKWHRDYEVLKKGGRGRRQGGGERDA